MEYQALKHLHMGAVALSAVGFTVRGLASLTGAAWVQSRPAKIVPHVVDTVLLVSAIALAATLHLNPTSTPWLLAKIIGLVLYIALGVVAMRASVAKPLRATAWVAALLVLGWMASVAVSKNPAGFLHAFV
ncbi:invasion protein [Rhodoferax lacus]|uniref:Invasion protein n=1 Tax=Rhodoferax lacus TaxID=2184758 RepID=A0A3E1RDM5_9BURK|nr:SirB2 family protein [Rhodoferax lacus]RFO97331.1 invasion protein [Rhodoferax lacus]